MDDDLCGEVNYTANKKVYDIACGSAVIGSSVKVALNNEYLTLCEVVVFGKDPSRIYLTRYLGITD